MASSSGNESNTLIMHRPHSSTKVDMFDDLELQFQNGADSIGNFNNKLGSNSNSSSTNNSPPDNKMVFDNSTMQWKGNEDELDIFEDIDNL